MSDRVKSNSMQDVFHAAGNSANIDFGKYAPKDKMNPLGAREMSEAIEAMINSNYNTGEYPVEYGDESKAQARTNIGAAGNAVNIERTFSTHPATILDAHKILNISGEIPPNRSGSGEASSENVRNFTNRRLLNIIGWKGKNICGGTAFRDRMKAYLPNATINDSAGTITFAGNTSTAGGNASLFPSGIFKPNTQYTMILAGYNTGTSSAVLNLAMYYTNGTNSLFTFDSTATTKQTKAFVSAENKTLQSVVIYNRSGSNVLYYNECGLFEGVKTVDDYEAFDGFYNIKDLSGSTGFVAGGVFDYNEKTFKPYKYYAEYDGETLVGPWLSNKDEYSADGTPTNGARVVDLGSFDDDIAITDIFPIDETNININVDTATITINYDADTNSLLAELFNSYTEFKANTTTTLASLDARVTALENPPAQTNNSVSPSNSPLNLDTEITRPDVEISELDIEREEPEPAIEPNEPTESTDNI